MWVTKLLISQVKKRIFCPKTTKFGPKLAFLVNLGQAMQAYSVPSWWVGWWLWRAGCISQDTYLLYLKPVNREYPYSSVGMRAAAACDHRGMPCSLQDGFFSRILLKMAKSHQKSESFRLNFTFPCRIALLSLVWQRLWHLQHRVGSSEVSMLNKICIILEKIPIGFLFQKIPDLE